MQKQMLLPQITRLVKLMYLAEVEYYRLKGRRLTDLDWQFHLYGPYPPALRQIIGEPEIEISDRKNGKVSKQIRRDEDSFMNAKADSDLELLLNRIVQEWGDSDLNQLLDYVYFETEPMLTAKRGETLDFSGINPYPSKKLSLNLDRTKLQVIRRRVAERAASYSELRKFFEANEELKENVGIWDKEETRIFPCGPCRLDVRDLVPEE